MMVALKIILCVVISLMVGGTKQLCPSECRCYRKTVDCQGESISTVPTGIPGDTEMLFIRNTKISNLEKNAFVTLGALRNLYLMENIISKIDIGSFDGLFNLNFLDLHQNNLTLSNFVYRAGLFRNLSNLMTLQLHDNSKVTGDDLEYPDEIGNSLPNLKFLTMDGLNDKSFPCAFSALHKLTNLSISGISGHCKLTILRNTTFEPFNTTNLRHLDITNCSIVEVESNSLTPLHLMTSLKVSHQTFPSMETVTHVLYGFRKNPNMRYLSMNDVMRLGSYSLTLDAIRHLKSTKITELYFNYNFVTWFGHDWYRGIPITIKTLSFIGNYFVSPKDKYFFITFPNLVSFSISVKSSRDLYTKFPVPAPLSLQSVTITGTYTSAKCKGVNVLFPNNIIYIAWIDSVISRLTGSLAGLKNLSTLILTNIKCEYVSPVFFGECLLLKYLNMSTNLLGDFIASDVNCTFLIGLEKLEILDLSNNGIRQLPHCMLTHVYNLKEIHMHTNSLIDFNATVRNVKHLEYLNLALNEITSLSRTLMNDLTPLFKRNNLSIDLRNNHLSCSCESLDFLKWLQTHQFNFVSIRKYVCYFSNNTSTTLSDVNSTIFNLDRECESLTTCLIISVVLFISYTGVILVAVLYKQRMHLFYWYHAIKRPASRVPVSQDEFRFDAFVSFAESESDFIKERLLKVCEEDNGLKLCLHFREFIPGTMITDNIVNAIHFSRKTVIILSNEFLKSDWCMYEFNMARMESIYSGRETLIIIKYDDVNITNEHLNILEAMKSQTYGVLPRDPEELTPFWRRLVSAIKSNDM